MMPASPGEAWFTPVGQKSRLVAKRGWGRLALSGTTEGVIHRTSFGWGPTEGGCVAVNLRPGEVYLYQVRHVYFSSGVVLRLAPSNDHSGRQRTAYSVVEIIT
jgi:hypothetical protein